MVSEIALAVVLLVGAALLIRTSLALGAVKPGFDAENVLTMRMSLTGQRFVKSAGVEQWCRMAWNACGRFPGVELASATCCVPLEGGYGLPFLVMGRPLTMVRSTAEADGRRSRPDISKSSRSRCCAAGRSTSATMRAGAPVVVINQAMAKRFWPKGDPLNDKIWIGKGIMTELAAETPRQIIGIVGDVRDGGLNHDPGPTMYVPNAQVPDALNELNVRADAVGMGDSYARQSDGAARGDPGATSPGERPAGFRCADDGRSDLPIHIAAALQHAADDACSAARRCFSPRSASTV